MSLFLFVAEINSLDT